MIRAAVVGSTGYSGQELVDILLKCPDVELSCLTARVAEPVKYSDLYPRFAGRTDMMCENLDKEDIASRSDIVFLALPHTVSMRFAPYFLEKGVKVVDLSADYRIPAEIYGKWYGKEHSDRDNIKKAVYGLPEMNRDGIRGADIIANPGCYPTSVVLALLPVIGRLAGKGARVIVDSKSGTSGAGRKASVPLSFTEVDEDFKCYKANEHQHMPEMEYVLSGYAGDEVRIDFAPHLLPVKRGILSTIYIPLDDVSPEDAGPGCFAEHYSGEPFIRVRENGLPGIGDVAGTNFCDIGVKVTERTLIIVSVIDNLIKGASGQAVQNMNLMFGLDETAGLL
jgi:N-acetyl-gamma-glutamyl-phosphate reductase